jgi:signal transduction histidine kinase
MPVESPLTGSSAKTSAAAGTDFLKGGGEAGARLRAVDWQRTVLGAPAAWPQSLKTIVRVMLDSRYAMWMQWGAERTFFCNDAYLPTVGIKRDWVMGARADKVWEEIWPEIGPRIQHVLGHGEATWDEGLLLFLERSGFAEETYHTFSYSPVYDDNGVIAGMLCVVTEVTERVIGERQLHTLRDLAALSSGTTVQQAADQLVSVLAASPQDVPFVSLYLLNTAEQRAWLAADNGRLPAAFRPGQILLADPASPWPLAAAVDSGVTQLIKLPDGGIELQGAAWPDAIKQAIILPVKSQGSAATLGVIVVGVSPRRPLNESYRGFFELIRSQFAATLADSQAFESERARAEALSELDRAKTTFFSNVSHEFRTPLTLMLGPAADLLDEGELSEAARSRVEMLHRNALRLQRLVNSLLDFTRVEAGRSEAHFQSTDLASLTAELASNFRAACDDAGLELKINCPPLSAAVFVDRDMWEKIVLNLMSNAFKFTLAGSISVDLVEDAQGAILRVADTGTGITAEQLPQVFKRFHRIAGARARSHEGSGIGLALVQELATSHGGSVTADSVYGAGTTFTVRLPFGTQHLPPDRVSQHGAPLATSAAPRVFVEEIAGWTFEDDRMPAGEVATTPAVPLPPDAAAGGRPFVLLADDNADMRQYVLRLLGSTYEVMGVGDGRAALAVIRKRRPQLVLSDVMMPNLDGYGLLQALRADPATAAIPVIFLSARAGEQATVEGLDAGADDYLVKPFSARELLARVGSAITLARVRAQAAEQLRISDERFKAVQETSPDGFMVLDAVRDEHGAVVDFIWSYANEPAARLVGQTRDFLPGRRLLEVHPGNQAEGLFERYVQTIADGIPWVSEVKYERDDLNVMARIAVARVGDGLAISIVDLSARWRAEEALREAGRQKDEFLAMLAHELRNPLAPIRNASELLAKVPRDDSRSRAIVDIIRRQVVHLTRLVDDLLDVSRITQRRIELKRETVDISEVIKQAVETVEPLISERRHRLQVISNQRSLCVNGDFARLVQCVVNVITNAAKYTDPGGAIRVESREDGGRVVIEVSDNGAGIPESLVPRIFELFVQGKRTLDRAQGGLGIGLSVVQKLIEMHGGGVEASSEGEGRGSTFRLTLPLVVQQSRQPLVVAAPPVAARRILIVDDNLDAASSLAMVLSLDGHQVDTVSDGVGAIEYAAKSAPDVILLDIGLPQLDGYEVARRIRQLPQGGDVRLIALTGYGQPEDRARALREGFDDHLVKPVEFTALSRSLAGLRSAGPRA